MGGFLSKGEYLHTNWDRVLFVGEYSHTNCGEVFICEGRIFKPIVVSVLVGW